MIDIMLPILIVGGLVYGMFHKIAFGILGGLVTYLYFIFDSRVPFWTLIIPIIIVISLAKFRYKLI